MATGIERKESFFAYGSGMAVVNMSITFKLLLWSLALAGIFSGAAGFLFTGLESVVQVSTGIIGVNYAIDIETSRMIGRLISMLENRKRYNILKKEESAESAQVNFKEYSEFLKNAKERIPDIQLLDELSAELTDQIIASITVGVSPELAVSEETVNRWIDSLSVIRQRNREEIQGLLLELNATGRKAAQRGLASLAVAILLGLVGVVVIAFRLNRSLAELRRGIRNLSVESHFVPLRSHSHDELGELAGAFNDMAERLQTEERMRADFISMLSHEIRTPLTSIRESINLLLDGVFSPLNEKQTHFLEISLREVDRLTDLLTRLLRVSSLESSKLFLVLSSVHGRLLVESALERVHGAALAKHLTLVADLSPDLCPVLVDLGHIEQVLLNLLGNAIKFSPLGGIVRAGVWPAKVIGSVVGEGRGRPGEVIFLVEDQGPGIPFEDQPHVFLKYYRASNVRDSIDGAGLGLGISKAIIEAHGGRLWLESEPGRGARFYFSLPSA
ncbi:Histidine kinase [Desulfovibrionales bacterium]